MRNMAGLRLGVIRGFVLFSQSVVFNNGFSIIMQTGGLFRNQIAEIEPVVPEYGLSD